MNKAFVREPDSDGRGYCPRCGVEGKRVGETALRNHLPPLARQKIGASAWFCGFAQCEVAYFDAFEQWVPVDQLIRPVYPKDAEATLCSCFGFSQDDIDTDLASEKPFRIRALLAKSQTDAAKCHELAPSGECCLTEIMRIFMRQREANQGDDL